MSTPTKTETTAEERFRLKLMIRRHQQPENRVEERVMVGLAKESTDHTDQR